MEQVWTWLAWLLVIVLSVVAIRASVRFDINEWLRERSKQREKNLRMLCPHTDFSNEDGKLVLRSSYVSPLGTTAWQCQKCGDITHDYSEVDRLMNYWAKHPDELSERNKRTLKEAKKLGRHV